MFQSVFVILLSAMCKYMNFANNISKRCVFFVKNSRIISARRLFYLIATYLFCYYIKKYYFCSVNFLDIWFYMNNMYL